VKVEIKRKAAEKLLRPPEELLRRFFVMPFWTFLVVVFVANLTIVNILMPDTFTVKKIYLKCK
jgi:hypothetical protein